MQILDQIGRELAFKAPPKRVVSLVPSITELLFDLGFEIIGRTKFCIHPKSIPGCEVVGGTKNVHIEKVFPLNPELVVANKEENLKDTVDQLINSNLKVYVSDVATVQESLEMITALGLLGNFGMKANSITQSISEGFKTIQSHQKSLKVLYLIWNKPFMAAGVDTFISDILGKLNLENCISHFDGGGFRYPEISLSQITHLEPDVILLSSEPYPFKEDHVQDIMDRTGIKTVLVDGECFSWYGSRISKSLKYLSAFSRILRI